jgi:hypothetical protein
MALRDLKSSLKNLKVDKDRPFGGSSGLPYIKGGLPEDSPAGEYLADLARYSSEGTVRGGLFSVVSSATDSVRVSRFLNDFPKGLLFTSKQIGLQKSNPKIETQTRGEVLNTQVYSNSNLLAQIALQGTGEHVPRPGFNTNNLLNDENKYEKIVSKKTTDENRLVTLYNNKIQPPTGKILPSNLEALGISDLPTELFKYGGGPGSSYGDGDTFIPRVVDTTTSYDNYIAKTSFLQSVPDGGIFALSNFWNKLNGLRGTLRPEDNPPSDFYAKLGNLKNQIEFDNAIPTEEGVTLYQEQVGSIRNESDSITDLEGNSTYLGNTQKYSQLLKNSIGGLPPILQDFRQNTDSKLLADSVSYFTGGRNNKGFNRETRIGLGNPGSRTREQRSNFYIANPTGQDKINMTPIYRKSIDIPVERDSDDVRDLIKFVIESIDNGHPDETNRMHFRAFITNFSDNIGADWDSKKYMGRGENFYTYQGFTRDVGFTFVVAAQSVQEMEKMYQKLNYLASTLHPDYGGQGFMKGTIHQLTIGEYFYRTPGIITSMNISVEDEYPWEIKMKQPEVETEDLLNNVASAILGQIPPKSDIANNDRGQMELPQILKIQMSFKPIMNRLPQKGFQEPIIVSAGRNIGSLIANNYLERDDFKEIIKNFGGVPVDTDNIIPPKK